MGCPKCQGALETVRVASTALERCARCQGVWIDRAALLQLRDVAPAEHPLLAVTPAPDEDPAAGEVDARRCAGCGAALVTFNYRGGKTLVDSCKRCDKLFLDRGELGRILQEWREGFEMTEAQRAFLRGHREHGAWGRLLRSKLGLGGLALGAVTVFLVLFAGDLDGCGGGWYRYRHYGLPLPLAALAAIIWYALRRRQLRFQGRQARKVIRKLEREDAAAAGRPAGRPSIRPAPAKRASRKTARCPWCDAPIEPGATRCAACDSDVF